MKARVSLRTAPPVTARVKPNAGGAVRRGAALFAKFVLFAQFAALANAVAAVLPARNLCIELRAASADGVDSAGGWQVSSTGARAAREQPPQRLCVQNGERAALNFGVTRPVQVWQAAPGVLLPVPVPTTQWIPAGQRVDVRVRWGGKREPVQLEIDARASRFDPSVAPGSGEAPSRAEAGVQTTLRVPLDTWVTIASAGDGADGADRTGVVSTAQARAGLWLQVRIRLAP
jgi:hypothetical protein